MKRTLFYASILTCLCIALSIACITLAGCSSVARALNIVNPSYSIRDVRPRVALALPLRASTIDLDFDLGVDNPNSVGLTLDSVDFDLLVNNNHLLNSVSNQGVQIPANGYGEVHLRTRVGYENIREIFQQVADEIQGNRARYELRGNAYFNTPVGRMKFPVTVYTTGSRR